MRKKRIGGILGQCFLSLSLLTGCACQRQDIVPTSECSSSSEREERMDPLTDRSDESEFSEGSSRFGPDLPEETKEREGPGSFSEVRPEETEPTRQRESSRDAPEYFEVLDYSVSAPNLFGFRIGDPLDAELFSGVAILPPGSNYAEEHFVFDSPDVTGHLLAPVNVIRVDPGVIPAERFRAEVILEGINGEYVSREVNCKLYRSEESAEEKGTAEAEEQTEAENFSGTDGQTGPGSEIGSEAKTEAEVKTEAEAKTESKEKSEADAKIEAVTGTGSEAKSEAAGTEPEAGNEAETKIEKGSSTEAETETFSGTDGRVDAETPEKPPEKKEEDTYRLSRAAFDHINEYRKELGLPAVSWDEGVYRLMRIRLSELEFDYSHREYFADRVGSFSFEGRTYGFHTGSECIAWAKADEWSALEDWKGSPEHDEILRTDPGSERLYGAMAVGETGKAVFTLMYDRPEYYASMEECWIVYDSGKWEEYKEK